MSTSTPVEPRPVEPRLAATVVLLRDGAAGPEVFMVVRHEAIEFASGALVFPGGRLEAADREIAADPALCPPAEGIDAAALAFRVAALRETFEECGMLLARPRGSRALLSAAGLLRVAEAHQAALAKDGSRFGAILREEGLVLAVDLLVPFAHWITPATQRKRYDTHFLMARAPEDQVGVHDGLESVDSVWIRPQDALDQTAAGRYKLVFATQMNLGKLARHGDVASALAAARAAPPVTVMPELIATNEQGHRRMRIPEAAGYGGEEFWVDVPPAIS